MSNLNFQPTVSRNILIMMATVTILLLAGIWLFREPLTALYIDQNATPIGLFLNGFIILLFLLGMIRTATLLWRYWSEEISIRNFLDSILEEQQNRDSDIEIDPDSIIAKRYMAMAHSHARHVTPNHAALSQILLANESVKGSLPRYINSILILTGVFGTIVSLSIALMGTSSLLEAANGDAEGINLVIHGMSTALSTTTTAIVCYIIFGYFYLRTNLSRTRVISAVEQITTEYLMPRFKVKTENFTAEVTSLVESLRIVAQQMITAQSQQSTNEAAIRKAIEDHGGRMDNLASQLDALQKTMLKGFRLNADE
jgi:hypothetical protein